MNFWRIATKVFAFFSMFFAFSITTQAQNGYQLPAGTKILVKMDNEVNSRVSSVNDTFTTTIAEPVIVREIVVIPIGAVIEGRITTVKRAASGRKDGSLTVEFRSLRLKTGEKREIEGVLVDLLKVNQSQTTTVLAVLGGTAIGGILGAISGTKNGALIGAGIGAGAGTGVAFLRKGKDVRIKSGEKFEIEITKEFTLPVEDF